MKYHLYETGELCPCCGQPIKLSDPVTLEMFSRVCYLAGLTPWPEEEQDYEV